MIEWRHSAARCRALVVCYSNLGKGRPGRALASLALSGLGFIAWVYFPVLTGGAAAPSLPNLSHSGPRLVALALVVWMLGAAVSIAAEFLSVRPATRDGT